MGIWVPIGSELFYCRIVQAALCSYMHTICGCHEYD